MAEDIRFFFEYDKQVIMLPVNPAEIVISAAGGNKTEEVIGLGEINILRQRKLKGCTIICFLPQEKSAHYVLTKGKFEAPQFYIDFFDKVRDDKKPFRFIISGAGVNMLASIENFEYGKVGGDDDIQYRLDMKEYKPYAAKTVIIEPSEEDGEEDVDKKGNGNGNGNGKGGTKKDSKPDTRPKSDFARNDEVIVNGRYWSTAYGGDPKGIFNNFRGVIRYIGLYKDENARYPYYIAAPYKKQAGWVTKDQMKHI